MFNMKKIAIILSASLSIVSAQSIYVATNKADNNTIMAYKMQTDGSFKSHEFYTGGKGTGDLEVPALKKDSTHPLANGDDPLISAYGVTVTKDMKNLLVVNAGDASVSMFKINPDESLTVVNSVKIHDKFPLSVAESNGKVVIASVGSTNGEGSIEAMKIEDGKLVSINDSRVDLKARPSTVKFSTDDKHVIVTELVTGKVKSFAFTSGTLSKKAISTVDLPREDKKRFQAIPVGFDIHPTKDGDIVVVSEARFLTPDFKLREASNVVPQTPKYSWQTGSISTLMLKDGMLNIVSKDVLTGDTMESGEIANCWVAFSKDGSKLWAVNALSSSISLFDITKDGSAKLNKLTVYKQDKELEFLSDIKLNKTGDMLFQLVGNMGKVLVFKVDNDGNLKLRTTLDGLPKYGAYGLTSVSLKAKMKDTSSLEKKWQGATPTPMNSKFDIPLDEESLFAYLQSGAYKSWKNQEKAVHPSAGPHENVRAFINDTLATSLMNGNKEHPKNSVIVKEQYDKDGNSLGWAVMVKTNQSTDNGKGWFWYEVLSNQDISKKAAMGNGVPGCVGCHAPSRRDMILIPFPFK
ncbi:3-carboxymuconate cyclase-like [hydrothermal vent metagenome]|uniref:3-carboxymuconate cyclase-like n=1 Tax=hydrothermal vent metagenome TaxID=652676 RepID=A0A1W1CVW3_9ZZZZ